MITLDMLNGNPPEVKDELLKKLSETSPEEILNLLEIIATALTVAHANATPTGTVCEDVTKVLKLMGFDDEVISIVHATALNVKTTNLMDLLGLN